MTPEDWLARARRARRPGARTHARGRSRRALALALFQPRLASRGGRLRRLLAPALAVAALAACFALAGLATLALALALLAAALVVAILHQVFGIELDLAAAR